MDSAEEIIGRNNSGLKLSERFTDSKGLKYLIMKKVMMTNAVLAQYVILLELQCTTK